MAEQCDLLSALRKSAGAYDDESLEAFANRGLLRRAVKDLEAETPEIEPYDSGAGLALRIGGHRVHLVEPLTLSRCDCPATGPCRHLLSALLWLRSAADRSVEPEEDFDPVEIGSLGDDRIRKWAGSALFRRAIDQVAGGVAAEFEERPGQLVIRLPAVNQTVRWQSGKGLEGMLCGCHQSGPCIHKLTGLLKYQVEHGQRDAVVMDRALEAAAGTPRTRAEIIASSRSVVREMLGLGFSRISEESARRLQTLSVSAHGVDLPRLERALSAAAEEASLHARRRVEADPAALLSRLARIEMLCLALRNPAPGTVGTHRGDYVGVGRLRLIGIGAGAWTTRSGFRGVTAWFFDPESSRWYSWSDTRPQDIGNFDPVNRFFSEGPWQGIGSPAEAVRSEFQLTDAFATAEGRLSGRSVTRALRLGDAIMSPAVPIVEDWREIDKKAATLFGHGLAIPGSDQYCVLLRPAGWDPARLDPTGQRVVRPIRDREGRELRLVRPLGGASFENDAALDLLRDAWSSDAVVFGRLALDGAEVTVFPVTIRSPSRLWLGGLKREAVASWSHTPSAGSAAPRVESPATGLDSMLALADEFALSIAESGVRVFSQWQLAKLSRIRLDFRDAGFSILERMASHLESLETRSRHEMEVVDLASAVLAFKYVIDLHRGQMALAGRRSIEVLG